MIVVDLFSGLNGWSSAFKDRGHEIITMDFNPSFKSDINKNILDVSLSDFSKQPDVVLASPPCTAFSILTSNNWNGVEPITIKSKLGLKILQKTISLINELNPKYFIIENPRGKMRFMSEVQTFERRTITYCQYGMKWMKPTDLWGGFPPSLKLRPMCYKGARCHDYTGAGTRAGIVGSNSAKDRSLIPYELSLEVCISLEKDL